jgi:hypothetical protein
MPRQLFAELAEGFAALVQDRHGTLTLRRYQVNATPAPEATAKAWFTVDADGQADPSRQSEQQGAVSRLQYRCSDE